MAFDPVWSPEWVWLRYATFLRATLLITLFGVAAGICRRSPAAVRASLWSAALLALLPLPELRALPAHWSAHVLPQVLAAPMLSIGATMVTQSSSAASAFPWTSAVGLVWMLGAVLVLGWLLRGWLALTLLASRAGPVVDAGWLALLDEAAAALGIRRPVRLLRTGEIGVPLTCGTLRPVVLLPADADGWSEPQRRAVLLHELAHVGRLDCLLSLVAHAACALWWFHPGAWWAAYRLRLERERACDERVILAGVRRSDYAECLLSIADAARSVREPRSSVVAAGLLRRSQLRARLHAILRAEPPPCPVRGRFVPALSIGSVLLVVLTVGSMRLGPAPDVLWRALASDDWTTRAYAAESIARFGDPGSVVMLDVLLRQEPHPSVHALTRFGERLRERSRGSVVRFGWPRSPAFTSTPILLDH